MKKIVLLAFVLVLLSTAVVVRFVRPVEASETIYIRADGGVEGTTHISSLDNVTYTFTDNIYDEIVVQRSNITIDGNGYTLQGTGALGSKGISLSGSGNVTIKNTRIEAFTYGINITGSSDNNIIGNHITNTSAGIWLYGSSNHNSIYGNNITNNNYGIYLLSSSNHNNISGNYIAESNYGIWLLESSNNTISRNTITNNTYGVWVFASDNSLSGNTITNNTGSGVVIDVFSSNNTISGNNIMNNTRGVWVILTSDNKFCHNNFIDNTQQVYIHALGYVNSWDNGVEGNYWSDYAGVDLDHDGIGDSRHEIDQNNTDRRPLMGMFSCFDATPGKRVNVISNSTIEDFEYFESNSTIRMYVSNMTVNQTFGFCRVCIPKNLMSPPYTVIINDGATDVLHFNGTVCENDTHMWIYFAYEHSTHKVEIVPEFPTWTSMLLILTVLTVAIAIIKRRLLKTPIH